MRILGFAPAMLVATLGIAFGGQTLHAQSLADLHEGTRVRLLAPSAIDKRVTGTVVRRTPEMLVVKMDKNGELALPLASLRDVEMRMGVSHVRGAAYGAAFGGGLGLLVGAIFWEPARQSSSSASGPFLGPPKPGEVMVATVAAGVGLGAWLGALHGVETWKRVDLTKTIALVQTRHSLGLRIAVP